MRAAILTVIVILMAAAGTNAQKIKAVRDAESANILKIKIARNLPDGDLADKIGSSLAENPDKTRQAFIYCVPSGSKEV